MSDADAALADERDLVGIDLHAVRCEEFVRPEQAEAVQGRDAGLPRLDVEPRERRQLNGPAHEPLDLAGALREMGAERHAGVRAGLEDRLRAGVGARGETPGATRLSKASPARSRVCSHAVSAFERVEPEDLEVDDRLQPELRARGPAAAPAYE